MISLFLFSFLLFAISFAILSFSVFFFIYLELYTHVAGNVRMFGDMAKMLRKLMTLVLRHWAFVFKVVHSLENVFK